MDYWHRTLARDCEGPDVIELQTRLAGFRGTFPDGDFGPGTERQVMTFQRDYMKLELPTGIADRDTIAATDRLADEYPLDFKAIKCRCGECKGFGQGRFKGRYASGRPKVEAYYRYEYPGIHRLLLWALRGAFFYMPEQRFTITSGYRCSIDNHNHNRSSTNHHGKAIDIDVVGEPGEDGRDDMLRCDAVRGCLVATADAQVGWSAPDRKALEPSNIAPTWVHYDVRCYQRKYLGDEAFCTSLEGLNKRLEIRL